MTVLSWGTGRKDYSDNVEYATIPLMRSHQRRLAWTVADYTYYALDWPYAGQYAIYESSVDTTEPAGRTTQDYDIFTSNIKLEASANVWCVIALYLYENYAAYAAAAPAKKVFGTAFGYGTAEYTFKNPIFWDHTQDDLLAVVWSAAGDNSYPSLPRGWPPDYVTFTWTVSSLQQRVLGPSVG